MTGPEPGDRALALDSLGALRARLAPGERLLGLDPGSKTVGLAVSDSGLRVASPIGAMPRGRLAADAAAISRLAQERGIGGMVMGLPLNMDGSEGPRARSARDRALALAGATGLPVAFQDERMSTMAVERAMIAADLSRKKRARKIDGAAAAYILQAALDAMARDGGDGR